MLDEALDLVLQGVTTMDEVIRSVYAQNMETAVGNEILALGAGPKGIPKNSQKADAGSDDADADDADSDAVDSADSEAGESADSEAVETADDSDDGDEPSPRIIEVSA